MASGMAVPLTPEQVHETQARILAIAERHMADGGHAELSLRAIAAEMGWTAASLYRYFDNKAELVAATRIAAFTRFAERMERAYAGADDLWDRSRAIGNAYVAFADEEPSAYKLMFAYDQGDDPQSEALIAANARSKGSMTKYISEMVEAGYLEGDPHILAHVYWSSLHGLVVLRMAGKLRDEPTFETLRHAAARLITRGARPARA